jgi:hypothetical protein
MLRNLRGFERGISGCALRADVLFQIEAKQSGIVKTDQLMAVVARLPVRRSMGFSAAVFAATASVSLWADFAEYIA